ncbi:branched-chain amino acid ABC transporter permease [Halovenus salina]|uniref:Branched-chain amino acid ABC transporter permease n=1 Tax=Halovenus salina TaxID=1510225 RepID=A0ABD5W196_9EURY|nr:branched-chain amino acid ABC transporter permease [Halovenus salina]
MAVDPVTVLLLGTAVGSLYALLSVGLTLVYAIGGIENLAHGSYVMIGSYAYFLGVTTLELPPVGGMALSILAGIAAAVLTWKGIVEHIMDNPVAVFMITLILALAIEEVFIIQFGTNPELFEPIVSGSTEIAGTSITNNLVAATITSLLCLSGLYVFVTKTYTGRSIVAVAQNRRTAEAVGINTDRTYLLVWIIAGAFAGLVGMFYGSYTTISPHMWVFPLIYSFSIVVVGGLGSIKGTAVAAYLISFVEIFTIQVNPQFKGIPALVALLVIIVLRPQGLFGREEVEA